MKCPRCGAGALPGARFCEKCGARLTHVVCPRCHAEVEAENRFCPRCGQPLDGAATAGERASEITDYGALPEGQPGGVPAPQAAPQARRCGCGCLGRSCLLASGLLGVLLLLVVAAVYFGVPQQLGFFKSPAEKVLADTPDREAAATLADELRKGGIDTTGMEIYVIPTIKEDGGSIAIARLDASKGFLFESTPERDPISDYLIRLATGAAARKYGIERVAIDYRDVYGQSLLTLTATSQDIASYAQGTMSRQDFMKKADGKINWPAVVAGDWTGGQQ